MLYWIILLANDIMDRYHDWPMSTPQFLSYINDIYSTPYATHHLLKECFEIDEVQGTLSGTDKGVEYKIQVFIPAKLLRERLPKTLEIVEERYKKVYKDATDKEIDRAKKSFIDFVELAEKIEKKEKTSCEFYASF